MSKYNNEYYIIFMPPGDEQIYLKPLKKTAHRKYHYRKLIVGQEPLFFENSYREEDNNRWPLTDVLVDTGGILVRKSLYDYLRGYEINFIQNYPAIYIDDDGKYHENYWYFGFYSDLCCLDKDKSDVEEIEFDEEDIDDEDDIRLEVNRYYLNEKMLDDIDEEKRLIFRIGECSKKYIFVHESLLDIFKRQTGVRLIKVADFIEGSQHS